MFFITRLPARSLPCGSIQYLCIWEDFMAICGVLRLSTTVQVLIIFAVLAVLAGDVQGRPPCQPFSCGHLRNVSHPFRRRGDPHRCGVPSCELACTDSKATIRIYTVTYSVTDINYGNSTFSVVDASLDANNSCPLPYWDPFPYSDGIPAERWEFVTLAVSSVAFLNCSQLVRNNSLYIPAGCLSTNNSFVYLFPVNGRLYIGSLSASCGYLGEVLLGGQRTFSNSSSFADFVKSMRDGFAVKFPVRESPNNLSGLINRCLNMSIRDPTGEPLFSAGIKNRTLDILTIDFRFWACIFGKSLPSNDIHRDIDDMRVQQADAMWILKWTAVLFRFVLAPLAVLISLAHKYWKTKITIDAVEKFLQMQQMLGPARYAYTDITAITSHFRDKLGQGGYGSVYKGVLLPGHVHVAVKMLEGSSNCNGEDFISEVSTIGRIHHVNVVRLMGFCSEEMRRALVYEYMPQGSLDKYIFSAEKTFSWDKLNEIALGIARGINYLHQGCEMQILHFDIKPHSILLDSNFIPKVADFGLAKLYPRGNSFVPLSALRGTIGYIAPEMISRSFGVISSKSDVYSFGMMLLEMAGGRRNADPNVANSSQSYYPSWVYDRLTEQEVDEISPVDDMHELEKKLCIVGLWCIQMKSQDRPTMSEVIEMLEGGIDTLQMPSRPFFCDEGHIHIEDSYHLSSELTAISEEYE